jgi:hypothetical protein
MSWEPGPRGKVEIAPAPGHAEAAAIMRALELARAAPSAALRSGWWREGLREAVEEAPAQRTRWSGSD